MATVDKAFRIKNGLVVEGSSATVNGSNVLTEASTEFLQDTTAGMFDGSHTGISFSYNDTSGKLTASVDANPSFTTSITFEGATADDYETTLQVTDATADRTVTLPDASGTVALTSDLSSFITAASTSTLTNKTISVDSNTISGVASSSFVLSDSSGNIDGSASQKVIPTGAVVGASDTQTLTNKTISGSDNTLSNIGNSSLTNSAITINGTSVSLGGSRTLGTDDVSEGSTNKYFTDERAQDAIAAAITNGTQTNITVTYDDNTNALSFNASGGVSSLTGTANEVTVSSSTGAVTIGLPDNVTITTDLTVGGNLTVNGTTTTINSTTVSVDDKNIELASTASPSDASADGAGITVKGTTDKTFNWVDSTDSWTSSEHMNLASGKEYKLNGTALKDVTETLTNKSISGSSNTLTNIPNNALSNSAITINGTSVSLGGSRTLGTDDVSEGTTNKYFTAERAEDAAAGLITTATHSGISVSYTDNGDSAGTLAFTNTGVTSITGTADQITASASTGSVTLSLPQSINTTSSPTFASLSVGSGSVTSGSVTLADALIGTATTSLSTSDATVVDSWSASTYSSAKYIVQMKNGTDIEVLEVLVTINGDNNVYLTEYADVQSNAQIGTTDADFSGGNVRLKVTASSGTTVKVHKTLIEA